MSGKIKVKAIQDGGYYGHRRMKKGNVFFMETEVMRIDRKTGKLVNRAFALDKDGKIILPTWVEAIDKSDVRLSSAQYVEPELTKIESATHVELEMDEVESEPVRTMPHASVPVGAVPPMPNTQKPKKTISNQDVL